MRVNAGSCPEHTHYDQDGEAQQTHAHALLTQRHRLHCAFLLCDTTMTVTRDQLHQHINTLLNASAIKDYCPNGLQVAGRNHIKRIVTGVTACQALLDAAAERGADTVLVHHGYFWKGEDSCITGIKQRRLKTLLLNDMNLFAYHLPLDVHPTLGNNAQLAHQLSLTITGELSDVDANAIGYIGTLPRPMSARELCAWINGSLQREPQHIGEPNQQISTVAWCTGAAQSFLTAAVNAGVDAFITGEINEPTVHLARESGVAFFAAGHHATERYGVKVLGEHLANEFGLEVEFIDIPNPV